MKKVFAAAAALALCTGLLAGCGEKSSGERIDGGLADSLPIDLEFSSGGLGHGPDPGGGRLLLWGVPRF